MRTARYDQAARRPPATATPAGRRRRAAAAPAARARRAASAPCRRSQPPRAAVSSSSALTEPGTAMGCMAMTPPASAQAGRLPGLVAPLVVRVDGHLDARFCRRPSSVSLEAMGSASPRPGWRGARTSRRGTRAGPGRSARAAPRAAGCRNRSLAESVWPTIITSVRASACRLSASLRRLDRASGRQLRRVVGKQDPRVERDRDAIAHPRRPGRLRAPGPASRPGRPCGSR